MESPVQCECYAHAAPGFFSLAGTAVKASGTGAKQTSGGRLLCADRSGTEMRSPMPQAAFYGDWGRTRFGEPRFYADRNGVETSPTIRAFVSRKP